MLLAALVLKIGSYGCYRYLVMQYDVISISTTITLLAICGSIAASIMCILLSDMKSIVALSSVSYICIILALLCYSPDYIDYSLVIIMVHACIRGTTFQLVGVIVYSLYTRCLYMYQVSSVLITFIGLVLCLSVILGLPPFIGFTVELCYVILVLID